MRGVWTTKELEETLAEELNNESGSWDAIADEQGVQSLKLIKYTMHDDRVTLKFDNGHKERIFHPDPQDPRRAPDGDLWDVTTLGWV
ncbi:hypothetical protein SEA_LEONA_34 [Arthrobacter phage Leona]|nr:hypothetical protein SEA_LEONA_34 [Arthrobacter phage Leona]